MPTPPLLTQEQRRAAYEKALKLRRDRAELKAWLTIFGGVERQSSIETALEHPAARGMKVRQLLLALPGVADRRADRALEYAGIKPHYTVGQCGFRQVERLLEYLEQLPKSRVTKAPE